MINLTSISCIERNTNETVVPRETRSRCRSGHEVAGAWCLALAGGTGLIYPHGRQMTLCILAPSVNVNQHQQRCQTVPRQNPSANYPQSSRPSVARMSKNRHPRVRPSWGDHFPRGLLGSTLTLGPLWTRNVSSKKMNGLLSKKTLAKRDGAALTGRQSG